MSKKKKVEDISNSEDIQEVAQEEASVEEDSGSTNFSLAEALVSIHAASEPEESSAPVPTENILALIDSIAKAKNLDAVFHIRRAVRYRLFRIRDGGRMGEAHDKGLKAQIEYQFLPGMTWSNFTFEWDVAPNNPLIVIHKSILNNEWRDMGGKFTLADKMTPPAFTHQS